MISMKDLLYNHEPAALLIHKIRINNSYEEP